MSSSLVVQQGPGVNKPGTHRAGDYATEVHDDYNQDVLRLGGVSLVRGDPHHSPCNHRVKHNHERQGEGVEVELAP